MYNIINDLKSLDKKTIKIMVSGFKVAAIIGIIGFYILALYKINPLSHTIFTYGFLLFKNSLMLFVSFFICAIVVNKIKQA